MGRFILGHSAQPLIPANPGRSPRPHSALVWIYLPVGDTILASLTDRLPSPSGTSMLPTLPRYILLLFVSGRRHCILDVCQCQCRRPCQYSVSSFSIQCRLCLRQLLRLRCPRLRLRLRLRLLLRHPSPASVLKPGATPCTPAGFPRFLSHRFGPM